MKWAEVYKPKRERSLGVKDLSFIQLWPPIGVGGGYLWMIIPCGLDSGYTLIS